MSKLGNFCRRWQLNIDAGRERVHAVFDFRQNMLLVFAKNKGSKSGILEFKPGHRLNAVTGFNKIQIVVYLMNKGL